MSDNNPVDSAQGKPEEKQQNTPPSSTEGRSLEDLERSLYDREKPTPSPQKEEEEIVIGPTDEVDADFSLSEPSSFSGKRLTLWLGGFIVAMLGIAAFVFWQGFFGFAKDNVVVSLSGPSEVVAGEKVEWRVQIHNKNRESVEEGEFVLELPAASRDPETNESISRLQKSIPHIEPGEKVEETFSAVVIGGKGFERTASAVFQFRPAGSSITFQERTESVLTISSFPVELAIQGPEETVSGENVEIVYTLTNNADRSFNNMRVRLEYPSGFRFTSASDPLDEFNSVWQVGSILPDEERELRVEGEVSGFGGEGKIFRAFTEYREQDGWREYADNNFRSLLAELPLEITVELDEAEDATVSAGQRLTYTIRWQNNFDVPLTDLTLSAVLEGSLYDLATLQTDGIVSSGGRRIEWSKAQRSDLSVLQPQQEASAEFQINTRDLSQTVQNPTLTVDVRINSPTRPAGLTVENVEASQRHETRVDGEVLLSTGAYYNEPTNLFTNTGPYPLEVGEKTTFTVHWEIESVANSFKDVTIKAVLPSGISWEDETALRGSTSLPAQGSEISYDPLSREVSWVIDELPANRGGERNPIEAIFMISARPTPAQEGRSMTLLSETELITTDVFTGQRLEVINRALDSTLPEDPEGSHTAGQVQP